MIHGYMEECVTYVCVCLILCVYGICICMICCMVKEIGVIAVFQGIGAINSNVADSRGGGLSRDRPLQVQYRRNRWSPNRSNDDYAMLDYVHEGINMFYFLGGGGCGSIW